MAYDPEQHNGLWEFDRKAGDFSGLCGLDEAGRGPLAGPVCAACVCLKDGFDIPFLNDSKKLTEKRREAMYDLLLSSDKVFYGIGFGSVEEIESLNILRATFLAMNRAFADLRQRFPDAPAPVLALVDGNQDPHLPLATRLVVHGDAQSAHIAAASVIAKVTRDRLMREMDKEYPGYAFAQNKGYGSRAHYDAILELGVCPIHRRSFLGKLHLQEP